MLPGGHTCCPMGIHAVREAYILPGGHTCMLPECDVFLSLCPHNVAGVLRNPRFPPAGRDEGCCEYILILILFIAKGVPYFPTQRK